MPSKSQLPSKSVSQAWTISSRQDEPRPSQGAPTVSPWASDGHIAPPHVAEPRTAALRKVLIQLRKARNVLMGGRGTKTGPAPKEAQDGANYSRHISIAFEWRIGQQQRRTAERATPLHPRLLGPCSTPASSLRE